MSQLTNSIVEQLRQLAQRGEMTPEALIKVHEVIETSVDAWIVSKVNTLEDMIKEWELVMDSGDNSLYSLGLRRAVDVVQEKTAYSQLPILEKPDTPDEQEQGSAIQP
jgi:hypothetical protein